jgi:hypothetical protein
MIEASPQLPATIAANIERFTGAPGRCQRC